jgi:hypothetical protein
VVEPVGPESIASMLALNPPQAVQQQERHGRLDGPMHAINVLSRKRSGHDGGSQRAQQPEVRIAGRGGAEQAVSRRGRAQPIGAVEPGQQAAAPVARESADDRRQRYELSRATISIWMLTRRCEIPRLT